MKPLIGLLSVLVFLGLLWAGYNHLVQNELRSARQIAEANRLVALSDADIGDLDVPADEMLRAIPGVSRVDVVVRCERPTHRIVHLRDWHYVPRNLFAADLRSSTTRPLSDEFIDARHKELILEVEEVQLEQLTVLRTLVLRHDLHRVFVEGLTTENMADFQEAVAVQKDEPRLHKLLSEVKGRTSDQAKKIEREVNDLLEQTRLRRLELGAVGQLLVTGEIDEVLPLDDPKLLDEAKPIRPDGRVRFDAAFQAARHDGQVKGVIDRATVGFIVLGAAHDLSESVHRIGGGNCEYIRITTKKVGELTSEKRK